MSRPVESRAVADMLATASVRPAGLVFEGEAGIGKSTLLHAAVDEAGQRGFRVLAARSSAAESVMTYAVLADLLRDVEADVTAELPNVQRLAVDRVLLRADVHAPATDQREVAVSFLAVVEQLAGTKPVLLVIDDLQWLDAASQKVFAYAARRLAGRIGLLGAARTNPGGGDPVSWLHMSRPEDLVRVAVSPLSLGGLHAVVSQRLGVRFRRPTMVSIAETSAGNPFYALELARALNDGTPTAATHLPSNLAELVRARIGTLDEGAQALLLAASCSASPTVELVSAATDTDVDDVFELLRQAEHMGIIEIDGQRLRFEHPLLARGVYAGAVTAERRTMHRRLAEIVEQPELRARHLALAARHGDRETLDALEAAAEIARIRGAPAAAAELLDMAAELGDDTPELRIRWARYHFEAGDAVRARVLLEDCAAANGLVAAAALTLLGIVEIFEGSLADAAALLQRALSEAGDDPALRVAIQVPLSLALFNTGEREAAAGHIDAAVVTATGLGQPHLEAQTLSMRAVLGCWLGRGVDEPSLRRALELEDHTADTSLVNRPSMHSAMLLSFTGELERARDAMQLIGTLCRERGDESAQVFVAFHRVLVEIWRGNLAEAATIVDDAVERAGFLDGRLPLGIAWTMQAAVAAYAGREVDARNDGRQAIEALKSCGSLLLASWPATIVGFLEVSLGNYRAALDALEPLLVRFDEKATEIFVAAFLPDAVEAMVALDRIDDAEPLVDALERNGNRLDRLWMLAVGARCRAMLLAADGDVDAAHLAVEAAMTHHDRLSMPFERARTQVLMGQLQRRLRRKEAATATLRSAVDVFEAMGAAVWAERARAELTRADVAHIGTAELTPSERRVAELAAEGMTNRGIATALFISPKTVEANLARVYRKLDIHSRAQLGRHVRSSGP